MEIIYKTNIRNGYAKRKDNHIQLIIPFSLKNDEKFLEKMKELGEKLQSKIEKKIEKKEKIQIFNTEGVLLF